MRFLLVLAACLLSGACSTIIEGRSQQIMVNTNPQGADCGLYRQGVRIATVQNAPGSTLVEKTKHDIWICAGVDAADQGQAFRVCLSAGGEDRANTEEDAALHQTERVSHIRSCTPA